MRFEVKINRHVNGYDNHDYDYWGFDERAQINNHIPEVEAVDEEDAIDSVINYLREQYGKNLCSNERYIEGDSSITIMLIGEHEIEFTVYSVSVFKKGRKR